MNLTGYLAKCELLKQSELRRAVLLAFISADKSRLGIIYGNRHIRQSSQAGFFMFKHDPGFSPNNVNSSERFWVSCDPADYHHESRIKASSI